MNTKLSRRRMATLLGSAPLLSGTSTAQQAETPDPLAAAREQIERSLAKMEEFDLPMSAEPAFVFKP